MKKLLPILFVVSLFSGLFIYAMVQVANKENPRIGPDPQDMQVEETMDEFNEPTGIVPIPVPRPEGFGTSDDGVCRRADKRC